jgi:hypothetical protein
MKSPDPLAGENGLHEQDFLTNHGKAGARAETSGRGRSQSA